MPGIAIPSRRRRRSEDEDEDDSVSSQSTSNSPKSNGSNKRARLHPDATSEDSDSDVLPNSYRAQPRTNGSSVAGSLLEEVHKPGAIVRIKVKDFVTYSAAEFKCGPSLNMIIGPNGTGKSTLVCAICLGLGWPPSTLGRAKDLGEYVKTGQHEAEIEIELAAGPRQKSRNPVVRRVIKREGNKSSWFINGSSVVQKDVLKLTKSFHIQIDNLCQFLPQDRVVEFAAMTPVQLLESTQKAAASEEMTEWHNALKKLGASRRKRLEDHEGFKSTLSELQARQNAAQADVDRINERNELTARLAILEKCKPGVQYKSESRKYKDVKGGAREAEEVLRQLEAELEPSFREVEAKEKYRDQIKQVLHQRKGLVSRFLLNADAILAKIDTHKSKTEECDKKLQAEGKAAKERNINIDKAKREIAHLQEQQRSEPGHFSPTEFNERIREKDGERRENEAKLNDMKQSMRALRADLELKTRTLNQMEQEQGSLNTQAGQQNQKLRSLSKDTLRAWEWIQENQNMFTDEVYGPPIVTCSVKDKRISNAVETALQRGDFTAFTVTNSEDFNTLQRHVYGKGNLNLSDITIRTADKPLSYYRPPVSKEELQTYNLDDWLINGLNGPDRVLAMLCDSAKLQRTAFSVQPHSDAQFERLRESPVQQWTAGNQMYTIQRRREYGAGAVSTSVRVLKNATIWTDQPIDSERERELRESLAAMNDEISEGKQRHNGLQVSMKELTDEISRLNEQKKQILEEKERLQKAHSAFEALPARIQSLEEKLESYEEARSQLNATREEILRKKERLALESTQFAIDYAICVGTIRKQNDQHHEAELWLIEADSEVDVLHEHGKEVRTLIEARKRAVHELNQDAARLLQVCKKLKTEFLRLQDTFSGEEQAIAAEVCASSTIEELDGEMTTIKQRMELVSGGSPLVIQLFEKRAAEIEELTEKINKIEGDMEELDGQITLTREKWEPELDKLVKEISDAFSHNFDQIGCAGQVGVTKKEDDFGQWAIEIQVKFRENEPLSILTSHRQSGGERAVSTIFYLMALQSLARSPFRVVDEINQGMDPRNERLVHERMVDIACRENTSQYFLITPKLLSGLKYHERMAVHTIYSGESMPEDNATLDFAKLADLALRLAGKVN